MWIKEPNSHAQSLHKALFKDKYTTMLKVKAWKSENHANTSQKKPGVSTLTLDKVDFRAKKLQK